MKTKTSGRTNLITTLAAAAISLTAIEKTDGQIVVSTPSGSTSQNFDTLTASTSATAGTWTNDATLTTGDSTLDGWSLFNSTNAAITTYLGSTGTSTTGSFFSYGTDASDRALGGLGSGGTYFGSPAAGNVAGYIAFAATNTSAFTITDFTLGFNGEEWRNGGNAVAQTMILEYGIGGSFASITNWIAPGGNFDWTSPVATGTAAAVNGNVAGLVAGRGGTVGSLTWGSGDTLWIRWKEINDVGNDHGLAIDNFSLAWDTVVVPEPGAFLYLFSGAVILLFRNRTRRGLR